jgi:hypothetical protein
MGVNFKGVRAYNVLLAMVLKAIVHEIVLLQKPYY